MAKLFDTADAERLIQEHRMMLEELDEIAQYEDNVQIDIEKAANLVVTRNVLDVLRDIPVEETTDFVRSQILLRPMCIRSVRCMVSAKMQRIP